MWGRFIVYIKAIVAMAFNGDKYSRYLGLKY